MKYWFSLPPMYNILLYRMIYVEKPGLQPGDAKQEKAK